MNFVNFWVGKTIVSLPQTAKDKTIICDIKKIKIGLQSKIRYKVWLVQPLIKPFELLVCSRPLS